MGDGNTDHYCWQRPEDMTTSRQAYKIDPSKPGSDLAGETAAAMAAASIVFRASNPSYSHTLLNHAYQVFTQFPLYNNKLSIINKCLDLIDYFKIYIKIYKSIIRIFFLGFKIFVKIGCHI